MELVKLKEFDTKYLDQWFADTVDIINYNSSKIQEIVPDLDKKLTSVDTTPFDELRNYFDEMINFISNNFEKIKDSHEKLEMRINELRR